MGRLVGFLFCYILGGITLIPLLLAAVLLHAYVAFPVVRDGTAGREADADPILRPGDDIDAIKRAEKTLGEKFEPRGDHEVDVAAGYFAVCREYVPGGLKGKPPERTTPVGSTTVSAPSPSVYQTMYRSIFDRKPNNSSLDNKGNGRPQKKGGNVFYVVLRHSHLMLFDDDEQLEVRHVVSLAHHNVSIYSGGAEIPEGELFIKRNALCLSRRTDSGDLPPDGKVSKPFFLFSENCSDKEDFYFALLRNQERTPEGKNNPPVPLQYDIKDVIKLVQRLHSSEEHLQTRWLNAVIGRIFLALYKTAEVEKFVRAKIAKKISRVKTPSFLSKISLRNIDMGEAAPVITNPRLKELTVDGELVIEADCKYSGNFRIEVAATARIELGSRFKAREVNLLLAVLLKSIEGHVMLRIKPPPSNRFWVTFQTMPKIDMSIEPIVSSRQITYTLILRQIEHRIKEVIAESLVYPNWDDSPFYSSETKLWRGGIWADDRVATASEDQNLEDQNPEDHNPEVAAVQEGDVDEIEQLEGVHEEPIEALPQIEKSVIIPAMENLSASTAHSRKAAKPTISLIKTKTGGSSASIDTRSPTQPRVFRSSSFTSASSAVVGTDKTNADVFKPATPPEHSSSPATTAMAAISALSANSPVQTPVGSPLKQSGRAERSDSQSSISARSSVFSSSTDSQNGSAIQASTNTTDLSNSLAPPSLAGTSNMPKSGTPPESLKPLSSFKSSSNWDRRWDDSSSSSTGKSSIEPKRLSLAAVQSAAATAKKWGLNALQRKNDQQLGGSSEDQEKPARPLVMGRGQPLPPPGVPLPHPDKKTKTAPIPVPKRKALPLIAPPKSEQKHRGNQESKESSSPHYAVAPPSLPKRRSREDAKDFLDDGLFVVAAPAADSEPTTPTRSESTLSYVQPWVEDTEDVEGEKSPQPASSHASINSGQNPPRLPKRRRPHRVLSSSPEEDGRQLPSWMAAQEVEARSKYTLVDEDAGL